MMKHLFLTLLCICIAAPAVAKIEYSWDGTTLRYSTSAPDNFNTLAISREGRYIRVTNGEGETGLFIDTFGKVKDGVRTIRSSHGGSLPVHLFLMKETGDRQVRLMCDTFDPISFWIGCGSQAAHWLGVPNVCIGNRSRFQFHGTGFHKKYDTKENQESARLILTNLLPPSLREPYYNTWSRVRGLMAYPKTNLELRQSGLNVPYCD